MQQSGRQGLGLCAVLGNIFVSTPYPLRLTVQLLSCLGFLAFSVLLALALMFYSGFVGTPVFGSIMLGLYAVFIISTVVLDAVPIGSVRV
jgi:hypothetical protein